MDLHLSKALRNVIFPLKVSQTHNHEPYNTIYFKYIIHILCLMQLDLYLIVDLGDLVVGVVTHKHPEYYRVDINAPELATLR